MTFFSFIIFCFFVSHIFFGNRSVWKIFELNHQINVAKQELIILYNKKFHDNLYERIKGAVDGGKEICSKFKEKSCNLIKHCGWTFNENEGKEKGICTPVYLNNDTPEPKHTLPNKDALYYNNKLYNI